MKRSITLYTCLVIMITWAASASQLQKHSPHEKKPFVLLLQSYHHGLSWTDGITDEVMQGLQHERVELSVEYLDTKRLPYANTAPYKAQYLREKYSAIQPDLIIAADNNALHILEDYPFLFPRTPIVFCGINSYTPELVSFFKGRITGVVEETDPAGTLNLIRALQPAVSRVAVITCGTVTGTMMHAGMKSSLEGHPMYPLLEWYHGLSTDELRSRLEALEKNAAVLLVLFNRDAAGLYYSYEESGSFISDTSPVPVYGLWDFYINTGVVGGRMASAGDQGRAAVALANAFLSTGILPPVVESSPNTTIIDFKALSRHHLSVDRLPENTLIINKPFSFYEQYKTVIWSVGGTFLLLVIIITMLIINIRRRHQIESSLRASRENLQTTLLSIGDAVIAADIRGTVMQMNPVAEKLTGWKLEEAAGRPMEEVFRILQQKTRENAVNPLAAVLSTGESTALSEGTILVSRDGSEYLIADSCAPIRTGEGVVSGMVLVFRDISKEQALEEQLRQSQKMEAIGQLAGGIAHDFNNMLGGIMGSAEMLQWDLGDDPKKSKLLQMIITAAKRAAGLTEKLLAFSRKQPTASTVVSVSKVLLDTVSILEKTIDKEIQVTLQQGSGSTNVIGDASQLQSSFLNLCINAAQAMNGAGHIEIHTRSVYLDAAYTQASSFSIQPGVYLEIEIRDNGSGISAEVLPKIFEPFFSTKEVGKGTGLGLAAVLGTVQQHQGEIRVYTEEGTGTSFHIMLPVSEKEHDRETAGNNETVIGSGRILLIDDEEVMRAAATAILETLGYAVVSAENGQLGLDMFREDPESFDLIIVDMIMPEMNGRDCFAAMQIIKPDVRVVLASGFSREEQLASMKASGLKGFIRKPFLSAELSRVVHKALSSIE